MSAQSPFLDPSAISSFDHRSAARDALRGLAVGDAFGAQFFVPESLPGLWERRLPEAEWPWTDDTEMACSVFEALRRRGSVDQNELAHGFAHRHDFDRGYGPGMNRLLRLVREGGAWRELASGLFDGQGSWGNGAAMRVAPLGAWFAVDLAEAAAQAGRSARVTHTHPEAVTGTIAVAVAAACAARSRVGQMTGAQLLAAVEELTPEGRVRSGVAEARELLDQPHAEYAAHRLGNGRQVSAADTVPFALWCAARHLEDFEEALWACASAGGDVDTNCAIVGGIIAAGVGAEGIPAEWRAACETLPEWVAEAELGEDLDRAGLGRDAAAPPRADTGAGAGVDSGSVAARPARRTGTEHGREVGCVCGGRTPDAAPQLDRQRYFPGDRGRGPGRPATGGGTRRVGPGEVPPRRRRVGECLPRTLPACLVHGRDPA
jgi:ADP-ribosylglycohydrolase